MIYMYIRKRYDANGEIVDKETIREMFEKNSCIEFKKFIDDIYSDQE